MGSLDDKIWFTSRLLGWNQFLGDHHLNNIRKKESDGLPISQTDLIRAWVYYGIKHLRPKDINEENVESVRESMMWIEWTPRIEIENGKSNPYFCDGCSGEIIRYTAIYPDGSRISSLDQHTRICAGRKIQ